MEFKRLAWRIPSPERAAEGWVEGGATKEQLNAARERAARERARWRPDDEAWKQLIALHDFVGKHVRLQFWHPIMIMLEEEGPYPLVCDCGGIATLKVDGLLQPFLLVGNVRELPTDEGTPALAYLQQRNEFSCKLAPISELYAIEEVDDGVLEREAREQAPRQNRVTPMGDLIRTRARGTLMGNRGCLHDDQREVVRPFVKGVDDWKTCVLAANGVRRQVMKPGSYTELFFLDEATALAAGHRPCSQCRPGPHKEFVGAWNRGNASVTGATEWRIGQIDRVLQTERMDIDGGKVTYQEDLDALPNGTFVRWPPGENTAPALVLGDRLLVWTPGGYGHFARSRPRGIVVSVITPKSIVNALAAGYPLHDLPDPPAIIAGNEAADAEYLAHHPELTQEDLTNGVFVLPFKNWRR